MGPQDSKDVTRDTARDLSGMVGEVAALKADARHWLTDPEYAALRHRLEAAHAAAEAALVDGARVHYLIWENQPAKKTAISTCGV